MNRLVMGVISSKKSDVMFFTFKSKNEIEQVIVWRDFVYTICCSLLKGSQLDSRIFFLLFIIQIRFSIFR